MTRPQLEPLDPDQVLAHAQAVLVADPFPCLATIDGTQPRLRPVSPVKTDGFTVYIANLKRYNKTAEIAANPNVELCYLDPQHNQVRITGVAETVTDADQIADIWNANPLLGHYLGSADNPEFILYRVVPTRVRFMQEWALEYHEVL
ncbi:MAG: pyridoxamine 5'-phosphate oxidase family protein [Planctomycetaceae bacterium]